MASVFPIAKEAVVEVTTQTLRNEKVTFYPSHLHLPCDPCQRSSREKITHPTLRASATNSYIYTHDPPKACRYLHRSRKIGLEVTFEDMRKQSSRVVVAPNFGDAVLNNSSS